MRIRDTIERLTWTVVAAFLGALSAGTVVDLSALEAGLVAAFSAVVNFVTIVARYRLSVLPEPGEGLPGLREPPPRDWGQGTALTVLWVVALLLLIIALLRHLGVN